MEENNSGRGKEKIDPEFELLIHELLGNLQTTDVLEPKIKNTATLYDEIGTQILHV